MFKNGFEGGKKMIITYYKDVTTDNKEYST